MSGLIRANVVRWQHWADGLSTLVTDADLGDFEPGQFVDLAVNPEGAPTRSYSIASAPRQPAEFFLTLVEEGALTPKLFALKPGDPVWVGDRPVGMFVAARVPSTHTLWLISTGTGLAPYVSMLRTPGLLTRFERIVVVHGVRRVEHLAYQEELAEISADLPLHYVAAVTREEPPAGGLRGRIPALLASGELEATAGELITAERSHVMLCGNPDMVKAMRDALRERGLAKSTPRRPGQFSMETYW